jgi:tRNA dimethylallyltransferase
VSAQVLKNREPVVLFVLGPTACAKSDFALQVHERFKVDFPNEAEPELLNCDSVQFFAGVQIGAAKPDAQTLKKVPHHLVGHVDFHQSYTAGEFRRDALEVIAKRASQGVSRFLGVGGSGFYVQALEKGMFEVPKSAPEMRAQLEQDMESLGPDRLHEELSRLDSETAKRIQPADRYRIMRALEILRSENANREGEPITLSQIRRRFEAQLKPPPFRVQKIGLYRPRDILRKRVTERVQTMMDMGFLQEVKDLRSQGLEKWAPMQSVGYKEVQSYLQGELALKELVPTIVTSTMQLAKRQMTWFRKDPEISWFNVEEGLDQPLESVCNGRSLIYSLA